MKWKLLLLAAGLFGLVLAGFLLRVEDDGLLELTILHTNDLHAHYDPFEPWGEPVQGGVARLKTAIEEVRDDEDHVLLLDAGDQFQGTLFFTVGGAHAVADVMNELEYDAMCLGNHEFDSGPAELAAFIDFVDFPVLGTNVDVAADPDLAGAVYLYAVYRMNGCAPVGVIGLTTEHTSTASSPGPDIRFLDVVSSAQRVVDELEAEDVDVIIALTHLGYSHDLELAAAVDGLDVIVGGHSHTLLDPYPTLTESASGEPVLVVTAHEWGKRLGRLDVLFTDDGLVNSYAGAPVLIDESIREDRSMLVVLAGYRAAIDELMAHVVGSTDVLLNGAREDARVRETNLGNLICDAILRKTRGLGATIAIQNGGGIRASIPPGDVTMGQILEVLPFGNQITVLTLTGAQLMAALEHGVSGVEEGAGRFPQVGGMRYSFDPAAEVGARVRTVEVLDPETESYAAVEVDRSYAVATSSYLAGGGDEYAVLAGVSDRYDTGWLISEAMAEYVESRGSISPQVENRIQETVPEAE